MKESNEDFDFLQEVAHKISEQSKKTSISPKEFFNVLKDTFKKNTTVRITQTLMFIPIIIEKEDVFFTARSRVYNLCKGVGHSEEDAIQNLTDEINLYNQSYINTEKKLMIEEIVDRFILKKSF